MFNFWYHNALQFTLQFGKAWMMKEVEKYCNNSNGLSSEDICNSITNLLTSNRTNDALQNEVGVVD